MKSTPAFFQKCLCSFGFSVPLPSPAILGQVAQARPTATLGLQDHESSGLSSAGYVTKYLSSARWVLDRLENVSFSASDDHNSMK